MGGRFLTARLFLLLSSELLAKKGENNDSNGPGDLFLAFIPADF